jgi:hypothetical protein
MKRWLSAIVTGITLYRLMVIYFYIPACNVQTTGFTSLMLLSNSLSLSPSTHNWCSIHSRQTSILYLASIFVSQFHSGRGSFHKQTLECGTSYIFDKQQNHPVHKNLTYLHNNLYCLAFNFQCSC